MASARMWAPLTPIGGGGVLSNVAEPLWQGFPCNNVCTPCSFSPSSFGPKSESVVAKKAPEASAKSRRWPPVPLVLLLLPRPEDGEMPPGARFGVAGSGSQIRVRMEGNQVEATTLMKNPKALGPNPSNKHRSGVVRAMLANFRAEAPQRIGPAKGN